MKNLILGMLLFSSCVKRVPAHVETFEEMLQRTEGVTCDYITDHEDGAAPSCMRIFEEFRAARKMVPGSESHLMKEYTFFRPHTEFSAIRGVPLMCCVNGVPVQGVYFDFVNVIEYSHEAIVRCEALHALAKSTGLEHWEVYGHDTDDDPLHYPCGTIAENSYKGLP